MKYFDRILHIRVVTAEPEHLLSKLTAGNIELFDVCFQNLLTIDFYIKQRQLPLVEKILKQSGNTCKILKKEGISWRVASVTRRVVFLVGILLFLMSSLWMPGRVFFVETCGNEAISSNQILSAAEMHGIRFGMKAADIRSEEMKNQLLSSLPQLQWIGVDIQGTRVIIQVKERSLQENIALQQYAVSSIVAAKDGVITQMTVESGTPLFQVGQSVKQNDVIVSGYTDCGLKLLAENAKAEVFAHTLHEREFVMPIFRRERGRTVSKKSCYKLRIGKKVINLCNHSGISDATCVKMYSENYWTLPGNFQLPVSVIKVEHEFFDTINVNAEVQTDRLEKYARSYIRQQMIAGEIFSEDIHLQQHEDVYILKGTYSCNEMIGQVKYEEILE